MTRSLNPRHKTILTNDPSMTAWGWAVLTISGDILDADCVKTVPMDKKLRIRKGDDRIRRIHEINLQLIQVIKHHNVQLILGELPHGSQTAVASLMIGMVSGLLQTVGDCLEIPVEWYSESDAKLAICGKRSLPKAEMIKLIGKVYPDVPFTGIKWRDEGIADALAIHNTAMQHSPLIKMLIQIGEK